MTQKKRQKIKKTLTQKSEPSPNKDKNNPGNLNSDKKHTITWADDETTNRSSGENLADLELITSTLGRRWLLVFVLDFLINNWVASNAFFVDTHTNLILANLDIPNELTNTCQHFRWASVFRIVLFLTLTYFHTRFQGPKKELKIKGTCVFILFASSFLMLHLVYRLLLDSEMVKELTSLSYWFVIGANWTATVLFGIVAYIQLTSIGKEVEPEKSEEGLTRREKRLSGPSPVDKATIFKLLSWYRPYVWYVLLSYVFLVINASVNGLKPYYKARVLDVIRSDTPSSGLSKLAITLILVEVVASSTSAIWSGLSSHVSYRLNHQIRSRLFKWMIYRDMGFFDQSKTGELVSCLSNDTESFGGVLRRLDGVIKSAVFIVVMVISMWGLSWQLTLVVITGNSYMVFGSHIYGFYTKGLYKKAQQCRRQASGIAQEVLSLIRTVRSFGSEEEEMKRYGEQCQEHFNAQMKEAILRPSYEAINQLLTMLLTSATIYYGGHLVVTGKITGGDLVSFILYQTQLVAAMSRLLGHHSSFMRALGSSEKVFQYLGEDEKPGSDGFLEPYHMDGKVEFKDVTFAYPTRPAAKVVENLSFCVNPGEVVALVGPSGAGKSTCFNLIERFYPPTSGEVLLDSVPLRDYKHTYLRSKVAIVSQEPSLFARTITENIKYGLPDEKTTEIDIKGAAINANASSFIESFPEKYNTSVGEKGLQLSGGQKQRVAIARALVRKPGILLLDEATSALDTESEKQVQEALDRTLPGRTVMIIAHRLSTVQKADRILVLNRGAIVEQGSHNELLNKEGLYSQLIHRQLVPKAKKPGAAIT